MPELMDLSKEPESTFKLYGESSANPFLRRQLPPGPGMAERGAGSSSFIIEAGPSRQFAGADQGSHPRRRSGFRRLGDGLKQRGLLEDTLVIWGGNSDGRFTARGRLTKEDYGRDHHGRASRSGWPAAALSWPDLRQDRRFFLHIVENPVHILDLQATILACLGLNHERLTYRFQGRQYRLTDVSGQVVNDILT